MPYSICGQLSRVVPGKVVQLLLALAKLTVVGSTMMLRNASGMIYSGVSSCPSSTNVRLSTR